MTLVILTKPPTNNYFSFDFYRKPLKQWTKYLLGQSRGPQVVTKSLLDGLHELNYKFKLNPKAKEIMKNDVVYVNESVPALEWAIRAKKENKIKKLIAGPVISVFPSENNSIMLDSNIDLILFPSEWPKNFWLSLEPRLKNLIKIWPAGVKDVFDAKARSLKDKKVLIYNKIKNKKILNFIVNFLIDKNINYQILNYGQYKKNTYLQLLNNTYGAIFLTNSESQGLAMLEAWMSNVPTLVLNNGCWKYGNYEWCDSKVSSPYLTPESGMFFIDANDFEDKWNIFIKNINKYRAREYALANFTNKIIASNFIKLIDDLK